MLFGVYNELGPGHAERLYQRAVADAFRQEGLSFREQAPAPVSFRSHLVGRHAIDFLVEGRIVVELKQGRRIYRRHLQQVFEYLSALGLSLAIVANFGPDELAFRRVVHFAKTSASNS